MYLSDNTLCRQVVFIFPFVILFAELAKKNAEYMQTVWIAFPIAETLSTVAAVFLFKRIYAKKAEKFQQEEPQKIESSRLAETIQR